MTAETTTQYRPLSQDETSADFAYHVSALRSHAANVNNACIWVFNHKIVGVPCIPNWYSWDTTETEHVIALFVGIHIPDTFDSLLWTIGNERTAGSGSESITWSLYSDEWLYYGDGTTFDATKLSTNHVRSQIVCDSATHAHPAPESLTVVRGANGWCWLCLTALNENSGVRGKITSLDIWPYRSV